MGLPESVHHLHRLHLEGRRAVLGEHGAQSVEHHLGFGQISGRALDENVPGVHGYLQTGAIQSAAGPHPPPPPGYSPCKPSKHFRPMLSSTHLFIIG